VIRVERRELDAVVVVNDRPVIITKNYHEALMLAEVGRKGGYDNERKLIQLWPRAVKTRKAR